MSWSGVHRAFAVEQFFKTGSVAEVLKLFKTYFKLGRYDRAPTHNSVVREV